MSDDVKLGDSEADEATTKVDLAAKHDEASPERDAQCAAWMNHLENISAEERNLLFWEIQFYLEAQ